MYDLIVIGGGPAGLTATIYAIRKRINVLMVSRDLGGKTQWRLALPWIKDYQVIRGLEVVNKFKSELEYLDFARHMEKAEKVTRDGETFIVHTAGGGELKTKSVIIATGTRQQTLKVPGEKNYMMKGLCYSALSYAQLFIDKVVTVIGDADLALRSAAELATVASHVNLVGPSKRSLQNDLGRKLLAANHVRVLQDYELVEVLGDKFAESAVVKGPDGSREELVSDGMFIEKALMPNTDMVAGLVNVDIQGRIIVDCQNRTNVPGIFAAGDVTNTTEQVLVALGEGAKAAISAYEYLLPNL
jgi:alkyl hydroperoxide reductase subunit F